MEQKRSYRRRGTPDLPMASYMGTPRLADNPIPEYHPETEIVRVISGRVTLQIGGERKTFQKEDIFVIPGNMIHCYLSCTEDTLTRTLVFSPEAIAMEPEHFFQKAFVQPLAQGRLQLPPLLQPGHPVYSQLCTQFDLLENGRMFEQNYQIQRFSALMAICTALFPYCTQVSSDQPAVNPGNDAVKLCMRYIHNRLSGKITLEDLGQYCHLHPNYLCALFKNYTGQTIFDYLTRYRVETATQLLKNEDLPVGKIGELVGFRNESLFYRQFKAIIGTTPKAYARQYRNK